MYQSVSGMPPATKPFTFVLLATHRGYTHRVTCPHPTWTGETAMNSEINFQRRRFFGIAAMTVSAV